MSYTCGRAGTGMTDRSSIRWHIWPRLAGFPFESLDHRPEADRGPLPALLFVRMGHPRAMQRTVYD